MPKLDKFVFQTVLAVVSGGSLDDQVLAYAVKLVEKNNGRLVVLYVIQIDRALPIDAELGDAVQKAEAVLQHGEKNIKDRVASLEAEMVQSREIGYAVVEEALQRGAEVIVMGTEFTTAFGKFQLDEDIGYVLSNSHCGVVLLRGSVKSDTTSEEHTQIKTSE